MKLYQHGQPARSLFIFLLLLLSGGCATDQAPKKEAFFEKWETMAKESPGHSPAPRTRITIYPETKVPEGDGEVKEKEKEPPKSLPQERISLKMRQADVKAVIRALARASGKNILVRNEVKGDISVDFTNVPWDQAFSTILKAQGLSYVWDGEIIRVLSLEDMEQSLKLSALQEKHKAQVTEAKKAEPLLTMVVSVDYAEPQALKENLQDFLTKDKEGKAALGSIRVDQNTNSLIIQAMRDDLLRMMPIIEKLDKPTPQINIKANIVETTKETARNLGIQWGGMYKADIGNHSLFATPGGRGGTTAGDPRAGGFSPVAGATTGATTGGTTGGTGTTGGAGVGISGQPFGVNFPATMEAAASGSLGLIFGTIGGNVLEMQLNALQRDSKLNILSSPSITTLDNQKAFTENGEKVPFVTLPPQGGSPQVSFQDAVLRLEITPHVIDGKNLKMKILVKKDEVDLSRQVQGNPVIVKKQTETTLIVADGETIVISGLSKQTNTQTTTGIPSLKDVPGLGWLFKGEAKNDQMQEVLIFITPRILPPQVTAAVEEKNKLLERK